jgi:hypothetical protein
MAFQLVPWNHVLFECWDVVESHVISSLLFYFSRGFNIIQHGTYIKYKKYRQRGKSIVSCNGRFQKKKWRSRKKTYHIGSFLLSIKSLKVIMVMTTMQHLNTSLARKWLIYNLFAFSLLRNSFIHCIRGWHEEDASSQ